VCWAWKPIPIFFAGPGYRREGWHGLLFQPNTERNTDQSIRSVMKLRTKNYFRKQQAVNEMIEFKDISSFLRASFQRSKSLVVKKDILNTMFQLENTFNGKKYESIAF
jgi:Tfp pilus assembly ATPase PilU